VSGQEYKALNDMLKNIILWVVIFIALASVFNNFGSDNNDSQTIPYSQFIAAVKANEIEKVYIENNTVKGKYKSGDNFSTYSPNDSHMVDDLLNHDVEILARPPEQESILLSIFISWFPILLLIGVWVFFMRQMQGGGAGGRGAMSFGKSKARLLEEDQIKVTLDDVAGVEEAKEEVGEIVDFLRDPAKFQKVGAKIPRGVLMIGPPGTGKTLLARAIAGEAKVPFFTISGSDFVEMFVGVGASRVRDMFEQAKKHAPCIIFIDEIDAVGRHRGAGLGGGHDEREQTLNQLLVEMDGFEDNEGVIVIAATNRADVLDPALLRPGRFDRHVTVGLPDIRGREQILNVHLKKIPADSSVEIKYIARGTPGFSGADLANLINEAALFAAREDQSSVTMEHLEKAKDKILMGSERHSMAMTEDEKKLTAYHEAGHCIVGRIVPEHDPVYKVSIMPRGRALGITMFLPERDQYSASKRKLESQISSLFGGRIAEELIFGADAVTTGASNDIERATDIARNMITKWGLSDHMGPLAYGEDDGEVFLGRSMGHQSKSISEQTARAIDEEIRLFIDRNYQRAEDILKDKIEILHNMADALMRYETIDKDQINDLMEGREPKPPKGWEEPTSGTGGSAATADESSTPPSSGARNPWGGPAEQH
jgi:cell division protease FtsH